MFFASSVGSPMGGVRSVLLWLLYCNTHARTKFQTRAAQRLLVLPTVPAAVYSSSMAKIAHRDSHTRCGPRALPNRGYLLARPDAPTDMYVSVTNFCSTRLTENRQTRAGQSAPRPGESNILWILYRGVSHKLFNPQTACGHRLVHRKEVSRRVARSPESSHILWEKKHTLWFFSSTWLGDELHAAVCVSSSA